MHAPPHRIHGSHEAMYIIPNPNPNPNPNPDPNLSHEAMYINQLLLQADATNHTSDPTGRWAIVGIGLMPWDNRLVVGVSG